MNKQNNWLTVHNLVDKEIFNLYRGSLVKKLDFNQNIEAILVAILYISEVGSQNTKITLPIDSWHMI